MKNTASDTPLAELIDQFGTIYIYDRQYFKLRHGLRFVACAIAQENLFFLVRELFTGEQAYQDNNIKVVDLCGEEPPLTGIIAATLPDMAAAKTMVENFEQNTRLVEHIHKQ